MGKGSQHGAQRESGLPVAFVEPDRLYLPVAGSQLAVAGPGVGEPALHPAAAGVLYDALTEASTHVQVIAASQSADLLDRDDLDPSVVRAVTMEECLRTISEIDAASREIVDKRPYTLGELMRGNQIQPQSASTGLS